MLALQVQLRHVLEILQAHGEVGHHRLLESALVRHSERATLRKLQLQVQMRARAPIDHASLGVSCLARLGCRPEPDFFFSFITSSTSSGTAPWHTGHHHDASSAGVSALQALHVEAGVADEAEMLAVGVQAVIPARALAPQGAARERVQLAQALGARPQTNQAALGRASGWPGARAALRSFGDAGRAAASGSAPACAVPASAPLAGRATRSFPNTRRPKEESSQVPLECSGIFLPPGT